jgi:hypothetical protein
MTHTTRGAPGYRPTEKDFVRWRHTVGHVGSKKPVEVAEVARPSQMEALTVRNTKVDEHCEFGCILYALGDHFGSDLVPEGHKCPGESTSDGI